MTNFSRWCARAAWLLPISLVAQVFDVQVGAPVPPPLPLVNHADTWSYRRGTNEPQADWRTAISAALDTTWQSAPGGFGYGDPGIQGEATTISGMRNVHSTLYIRREFTLAQAVDAAAELRLRVDYDDGFVAYLDGVEVARRNVASAAGTPVAFDDFAASPREASCCTGTVNPPSTIELGTVGNRLAGGTHVLAILALNDDLNSSDLHIIADLFAAPASAGAVFNNGAYALTTSNAVPLSGTNTIPGSTRVTINGDDAAVDAGAGTWSVLQPLQPGWNRLFIAAHAANGAILTNLTQNVIHETSRLTAGGTLSSSLMVSNRGTVLHVTNNVIVPTNVTLAISHGAVVLVNPGQSIVAQNGGQLEVHGTFDEKVIFDVYGATNTTWGPVSATGSNSVLQMRFADVARAQVSATTGATGLVEDTTLHDFDPGSGAGTLGRGIMMCNFAAFFQARRVHVLNYYECLVRNGLIEIEDCVFEQMTGDALDFDSAQPGSFTRRCTYRHGTRGNVDAVDIGPADLPGSTDTLITDCIMWNFPFDKGVSVGDNGSSHGIIVSNCLIYACNAGVMAKDLCDVSVRNCTIVNNTSGFTNYNKANPSSPTGAGIITNSYNNILWNNVTTIGMANNGQLFADHNIFGQTNWPGEANIDVDPLFVDATAFNFRLQPNSPARSAGRDGANLGVTYPVGGMPLAPLRLAALSTPALSLHWEDDSQNEDGVVVQRSPDAQSWESIAALPAETTNYTDHTAAPGQKYYYRVQHTNYVGVSPFSNIASGTGSASAIQPELSIELSSGSVRLSFVAQSNTSYRVEFKTTLELPAWSTWTNIIAGPAPRSIVLTNDSPDPARFYRVVVP